ncbi:MAG: hypothetical protein ACTSWN_00425 [Promethearchaeota archaeon]
MTGPWLRALVIFFRPVLVVEHVRWTKYRSFPVRSPIRRDYWDFPGVGKSCDVS